MPFIIELTVIEDDLNEIPRGVYYTHKPCKLNYSDHTSNINEARVFDTEEEANDHATLLRFPTKILPVRVLIQFSSSEYAQMLLRKK